MKTIALIDYSLEGHHLSFLRSFARILLAQGNCVVCIAPKVEEVTNWVAEREDATAERLVGFTYAYEAPKAAGFGRLNETVRVLRQWRYDADLLKSIERKQNISIDLVFYAWIDHLLAPYIPPFLHRKLFPYQWSGLYFHPYHLRLESRFLNRKASWRDHDAVFLSPRCIGMTVHDLGIVEGFTNRIGKPVIHFPETADATSPDPSYPVAQEIRAQAKGRIVVGMIGCEKHKGTLTLIRLARKADSKQYFFAFLGTLPQATYSEAEWKEVQDFIQSAPENCYFRFQPIPEGAAYNAVFCAIDIPYLVYDRFISSSNRLTKAAIFERLVLASNNYCVGEDVRRFRLGAAVEPMSPEASAEGLSRLTSQIERSDYPKQEWEAYRALNSEGKLYERFQEITSLNHKK